MINVNKTAKTLDEGIKNMMSGAKDDYKRWSTNAHGEQSQWSKDSVAAWDSKTKVYPGKKYIKVVQENGVFAFIVKEDMKSIGRTGYKKGDILKPAGYNAPALNAPRGNVLKGNYNIQWTGPLYLRG